MEERLVKPWNQLQQAKVYVAEFLKDAAGGVSIDLQAELQTALATFETVLKVDVLQQFGKMFDMGNYADAEGDPPRSPVSLASPGSGKFIWYRPNPF